MRTVVLILFSLSVSLACQSQDTLTLLFVYGSKPNKGYKETESKYFGGIHGGHVNIRYRDSVYDFGPYQDFHVFAHKRNIAGKFSSSEDRGFSHNNFQRQLEIRIPLNHSQVLKLHEVLNNYVNQTPYDYAFIGYRCASNVADILGQIGVIKAHGFRKTRRKYFYPKILRTKLIPIARENGWYWRYSDGREERKWEKDKPRIRKQLAQQ